MLGDGLCGRAILGALVRLLERRRVEAMLMQAEHDPAVADRLLDREQLRLERWTGGVRSVGRATDRG